MTPKPKLQVTGYRGVWGETLNEQIAFEYIRSFARFIKSRGGNKVLIGRDTRPSGPNIFAVAEEAFQKEGIATTNIGILPTPSTLLLTRKLGADGGIMITASHNPPQYNGIKFVMPMGRMTNANEVEEIENFRKELKDEEKIPTKLETPEGINIDNSDFRKIHIDEVLKNVNVELIRSKKFKVTLDAINGTGAFIGPELLEALGCDVKVINAEQTGAFAHMPEPLPENLSQIAEAVKKNGSDIGFAQDPDADRLVVINEKGELISEEFTMTLGMKNVLSRTPGPVVMAISGSRVNIDIASEYGQKVFTTKQGEANVIAKILEINAPIGGEGGGGLIYPKINYSRDSLVGMGLILDLLAQENKKISEIITTFPKYYMKKDKFPISEDVNSIFEKLRNKFNDAKVDESDGLRFDWEDASWFGIRASNTEPIVRITGEAKTKERVEEIFEEVRLTLEGK